MNSAPSSMGKPAFGSNSVRIQPPMRSRASRMIICKPELLSISAAVSPAIPAPTMMTSAESFIASGMREALGRLWDYMAGGSDPFDRWELQLERLLATSLATECGQNGIILRRPFFFLLLLEDSAFLSSFFTEESSPDLLSVTSAELSALASFTGGGVAVGCAGAGAALVSGTLGFNSGMGAPASD